MSTLLQASITGTGRSDISAVPGRNLNLSLIFGAAVGTVSLERRFDGGAWQPLPGWTGVTADTVEVFFEAERGVEYSFNCTAYTSGTIEGRVGGNGYG